MFDIAFLEDDVINSFTSDFKLVARFFKNRRMGRKDFFTHEKIEHIGEFLDLISVFTNDRHYRKIKRELLKTAKEGRDVTMCMIAEALENEGIQKGMQKGIQKGIEKGRLDLLRNMLAQGFTEETLIKLGFTDTEMGAVQVNPHT